MTFVWRHPKFYKPATNCRRDNKSQKGNDEQQATSDKQQASSDKRHTSEQDGHEDS
jgi:nitric oxide reductase activation protein